MQRLRRKMAAKQASSAAMVTADGLTVKIASYQSAAGSHVTHFPVISTLALGDSLAELGSVPSASKEVNGAARRLGWFCWVRCWILFCGAFCRFFGDGIDFLHTPLTDKENSLFLG